MPSLGRGLWLVRAIAVTTWIVLGGSPRLWAEDVEAIVRRGIEFRRQGQDGEALTEFQKALQLRDSPRIRAQAALAEQALGLWSPAEENLQEALSHADDAWIRKNRATLTKALEIIQSHLGTLQIWGVPPGAAVFVDAKPVGTLPLKKPVRISEESALLTARADGYLEMRRSVRVPPGETVREHVELVPAPSAVASAEHKSEVPWNTDARQVAPPATTPRRSEPKPTADQGPRDETAAEPPPSPSSNLRPFAWVAGAGAVGALAFGVVETLLRARSKDAFDSYALPNPSDPANPIKDYCSEMDLPPECRALKDDFDRNNTLMIVGYAAAGALAIGSTILFLLSSDTGPAPRSSALTCVPDGGTRGLNCRLTF